MVIEETPGDGVVLGVFVAYLAQAAAVERDGEAASYGRCEAIRGCAASL
jgi:hypothetical protein